ncbi:anti-sigma factor [Chthonobacter rhizosphaerae]|uniref:anti-sigma factor n=1 Tax=Chthonobacter rhizosphaerae TaxID=2735553 RepID=UPI0015EE8572|nr:anti-sigma factor [Chthonobacter rhizosphaerae]
MTSDLHDRLAAEHVLGLLEGAEQDLAEALLAEDPAFARLVEDWRGRLAELDATAAPEAPPPALWSRIEAGLEDRRPVETTPSPAAPRRPAERPSLWNCASFWRPLGLAAAAASLVLAVALGVTVERAGRAPALVTVMLSADNRPAAVVNTYPDGRTELVPLTQVPVPEGKSLQVWTLWDRERGPVSVGLLDALRSIELGLSSLPAPAVDQLFEITLEPEGGSPTGRPTGPILMKGTANRAL